MAAGDDEPVRDAPASKPAPDAAPKPKRRFAPQLIEESVKSSSNKTQQSPGVARPAAEPTPPESTANSTRRTTRDASVQVDDVVMSDAPPPPPPQPSTATKPIRRFAPVPIETTFDSYRVGNKNPRIGPTAELTPDPSPTTPQAPPIVLEPPNNNGSGSSSSNNNNNNENNSNKQTEKKPKRRFAPQLIETTRRARKSGQQGPATKPTDKTDITPGTNHIYAPKPKRKPGAPRSSSAGAGESEDDAPARFLTPRRQQSMKPHPNTRRATRNNSFHPDLDTILSSESGNSSEENENEKEDETDHNATGIEKEEVVQEEENEDNTREMVLTLGDPAITSADDDGDSWTSRHYDRRDRRESCDEEFSGYLLAVAAREAYRQRELEQAMSAFPNGMRPQNVEHFFVRDGSEDDNSSGEEQLRHGPSQLLARRKSTDPGWAVKEMRAHAEKLAQNRPSKIGIGDGDAEPEIPPAANKALWAPAARRDSHDTEMVDSGQSPYLAAQSPALLARTESPRPDRNLTPSPQAERTGGLRASPFSIPFANFASSNEPEDRELRRMRMAASPPMLGGDLKFRTCPSPQQTRMEPRQRYCVDGSRPEDKQRDVTGDTGLWRGYCSTKGNEEAAASSGLSAPPLLMTPGEPGTPADPFSAAFSESMSVSGATSPRRGGNNTSSKGGLHMLSGLSERLDAEKRRRELETRILAEFDDAFVTQVYNYISLGYPATARAYDEELSKISGLAVAELRRDDENVKISKGFMLHMEMRVRGGGGGRSGDSTDSGVGTSCHGDDEWVEQDEEEEGARKKGAPPPPSIMRDPEEDERRTEKKRDAGKPPRWRALKLYIREWARQHPSLNAEGGGAPSLMAWGVRARRGSWAI
ncbi:hypothetical protein F4778DRAFT_784283 [Xylariomycetidae sp. FL2044]|nr:hypothetical protein F4778DRAFT_784283 [Xylariomycetidae sp. FL2044]